jgi:hypothetical protein
MIFRGRTHFPIGEVCTAPYGAAFELQVKSCMLDGPRETTEAPMKKVHRFTLAGAFEQNRSDYTQGTKRPGTLL